MKRQLAGSLPFRRNFRTGLPRYTPRYMAVTYLVTDPPSPRLACVGYLQLANWSCGGALLCYALLLILLHACCIPRDKPDTRLGERAPFCRRLACIAVAAFKLELRRCALRTALCNASSHASLHSRFIPRYRPNLSPSQRPHSSWVCFAYCTCTD